MPYYPLLGPLRQQVNYLRRSSRENGTPVYIQPPTCPDCGATGKLWICGVNPEDITDVQWSCPACMGASRRRAKHPERIRIWANQVVARAISLGVLKRETVCARCGGENFVQAHHADHAKPLEIEWLCSTCHADTRRVVR